MSLINFLGLDDSGYGNFAKGILYVICEIFWKIMHAIGNLVDVITGLFYKLTGANYLGSGSETLVEEQDLLSQLVNQNIVSNISLFMLIISFSLMTVFGVSAVVKQMYFSKDERKSMVDVIKNMVLAFIFLICLSPLAMFAMSAISTVTTAIVGLFGDTSNVSLADLMFNVSFSGDAVSAYNEMYSTEITSWTEMKNNFLFDINYGDVESNVEFYWYVYLLGGGVVLYNLIVMVLKLVKRIFMVIILYITAPVYVARMVDDGGVKFKEWKNKALSELISVVGTVIAFMVLVSLVGVISELELVKVSTEITDSGSGSIGSISALANEGEVNSTALLINNLTRMLLLMAGTSVAKDSGELLGDVFKSSNDDSNTILEGIFNRLGPKDGQVSKKTEQSAPRTRVITRTTTSTRKVINYNETIPSSTVDRGHTNITSNHNNTFNNNVSNIDRHVNNIQNRANVTMGGGETRVVTESGAKSGNYRNLNADTGITSKPSDVLNREFVNTVRAENDKLRGEWDFVKNGNSASSREVVKEFETASKDFDASLNSGEPAKIKNSMNKYVEAYRKEEKVAKEGYKDFADKSAKLSSDLSAKQQSELKNISAAYHKAQVDYSKTARKLGEISQGNMSTSDALRIKERADKQREKLMEASSKANNFYNNQKRGE